MNPKQARPHDPAAGLDPAGLVLQSEYVRGRTRKAVTLPGVLNDLRVGLEKIAAFDRCAAVTSAVLLFFAYTPSSG